MAGNAISKERQRDIIRQVQADMAGRTSSRNSELSADEVRELIRDSIAEVTRYMADIEDAEAEEIARQVENDSLGYGALQPYLDDDEVTEIMVNGHEEVFIERGGVMYRVEEEIFDGDEDVKRIIDKIASQLNKHCDIHTPDMDARLSDGSRVNAIIPPVARFGPALTIRKFPKQRLDEADLVEMGSASMDVMNFLACAVEARCNILVSGGTGSGKTTLLNILSGFIPETERVITVEDTAELQLTVDNWVSLEARSANADGSGEVTIHRLLVNCLRMRPDRIIVGECRSDETVEMLQAMNTGHDGSLTTIHANDPRSAFLRIETLVQATQNLSERNIDKQIASAIQIVVQIKRYRDGSRKISDIVALTGSMEGDTITTTNLVQFVEDGVGDDGMIVGRHVPTGAPLPRSIKERIELSGAYYDPSWLKPEYGEEAAGW